MKQPVNKITADLKKWAEYVGPQDEVLLQDIMTEELAELDLELRYYNETTSLTSHAEASLAKECLDVIWTVVGYMQGQGWDVDAMWDELNRSNLSKLWDAGDGKLQMVKNSSGKVTKGPNYKMPDLWKYV